MTEPLRGSYRDPSGYVFERSGTLYRCVRYSYAEDYDALLSTGLYRELADAGLLVAHEEAASVNAGVADAYRVLRPERVPFISYPYEWCFGQLRAAALCTLAIQRRALAHGMVLKDSSAYNVQFRGALPVFIDSLSFQRYRPGVPWVAYRQFCEHFLAPLVLIARVDPTLGRILRIHLDGIPLDVTARVLGGRAFRSWGSLVHILLHGRSVRRHAGATAARVRKAAVSAASLRGLIDDLERCVRACDWTPGRTEWAEYDRTHGYSTDAQTAKRQLVTDYLRRSGAQVVWDLGANTGEYSRLALDTAARAVAFDADVAAVERNYRRQAEVGDTRLLPLVMDLTDPSPALGFNLRERLSLAERGPADVVLALALIHHLGLGKNVPFALMAESLAQLGRFLIIEFVPKHDPQAQRLLAAREDVFTDYTLEVFERSFGVWYRRLDRQPVPGTDRILFLLERTP
jgi:SAM-dependent methyltransferase